MAFPNLSGKASLTPRNTGVPTCPVASLHHITQMFTVVEFTTTRNAYCKLSPYLFISCSQRVPVGSLYVFVLHYTYTLVDILSLISLAVNIGRE